MELERVTKTYWNQHGQGRAAITFMKRYEWLLEVISEFSF